MMVDRSTLEPPEAKVYLNTPYFEGEVIALCMENPLVEVILGNQQGARDAQNLDSNWVPALAVQTRAQAKQREQGKSPLRTPNIVSSDITPDQIRASQVSDPTLARIRTAGEEEVKKGNAKYYKKKYLIYRQYSSPKVENGRVFVQLVVSQQYRKTIMKLAHESIMSGHLVVKRTIMKLAHMSIMSGHLVVKRTIPTVLSEFFWRGISSDIKRYCCSCDICQHTIANGKTARAPLGSMPIIDTPFQRVAIDLAGPLKPWTDSKNKYILTLVDYTSRDPEAEAYVFNTFGYDPLPVYV